MSEIYHKYQRGEQIPTSELRTAPRGLELYGDIIHFEWRLDRSTSQPDFFGEVYLQKVHPVECKTPEQVHLERPTAEELRAERRIL